MRSSCTSTPNTGRPFAPTFARMASSSRTVPSEAICTSASTVEYTARLAAGSCPALASSPSSRSQLTFGATAPRTTTAVDSGHAAGSPSASSSRPPSTCPPSPDW